ncbi:co-chaperone YbbN [Streptomyces sp. wa1063]|uniref:thioredoxin family protein n=2 Tax=Streptomyces TaxID=1883 RepID=UPI00211D1DD2|nr:thioredoxin domain-containing protein [Streptomyces sp. wa1063]
MTVLKLNRMNRRGGRALVALAGVLALAVPGLAAQTPQAAAATAPAPSVAVAVAVAVAGTVVHTSDASFDSDVLRSRVPVLVNFCAVWSAPCRQLETPLAEIAREYSGRLTVAWHDIDRYPDTHPRYGVTAIPTLHLFENGQITATRIGPATKANITDFLRSNGI